MIYIDKNKNEMEKFISLIKDLQDTKSIKTIVINSANIVLLKSLLQLNLKIIVSPISFEKQFTEEMKNFLQKNKIQYCNLTNHQSHLNKSSLDNRNIFVKKVFQDSLNTLDTEIKNIVISASFALENNLIEFGEEVIGLDEENGNLTAMVILKPNYKNNIINTKIIKIIAKPIVRN